MIVRDGIAMMLRYAIRAPLTCLVLAALPVPGEAWAEGDRTFYLKQSIGGGLTCSVS